MKRLFVVFLLVCAALASAQTLLPIKNYGNLVKVRGKASFKADSNFVWSSVAPVDIQIYHDSSAGSIYFCREDDSSNAIRLDSLSTITGSTVTNYCVGEYRLETNVPQCRWFRVKGNGLPYRVTITKTR